MDGDCLIIGLFGHWYLYNLLVIFPGKGVAASPAPQCSEYWKGSLQVAFDYGRQQQLVISILSNSFEYNSICLDKKLHKDKICLVKGPARQSATTALIGCYFFYTLRIFSDSNQRLFISIIIFYLAITSNDVIYK